jgi:pimeloyl-ACP methyl ester carboxylesterase
MRTGEETIMSGIDEGFWLDIAGRRQWVVVRGRDRGNPALLFIGGAGGGFAAIAPYFAPWEQDFTMVHWDQPGGGFTGGAPVSYGALGAQAALVAEAVKGRLGLEEVALLATSGGTITALQAARARPELFSAYVGTGQIVTRARQEALSYEMVLARARAAGDAEAVGKLEGIGPPPYADPMGDLVKSTYANAPTPAEAGEWAEIIALGAPKPGARHAPPDAVVADPRAAGFAAFQASAEELWAFDARRLGTAFDLPTHVIQGEDDAHTVTSEVIPWAHEVGASLQLIPGAGHLSAFLRAPMLAALRRALKP